MAINYDAPTNTITVSDFPESSPCTFELIYQADVAGGWGVVNKIAGMFFIAATLWFEGTSSAPVYFEDSLVDATIGTTINRTGWGTNLYAPISLTNCTVRIHGINASSAYTRWYGNTSLIDCSFYSTGNYFSFPGQAYIATSGHYIFRDTYFQIHQIQITQYCDLTIDNVIMDFTATGNPYIYPPVSTISKWTLRGAAKWLIAFRVHPVIYNSTVNFSGTCYMFDDSTLHLVNSEFSNWDYTYWHSRCVETTAIYRQYEFDSKVIEADGTAISGATVTLTDINGDVVFTDTTDVDGNLDGGTQVVTYKMYKTADPNISTYDTDVTTYSPFTLTIEKNGFYTYTSVFDIQEKTNLTISMKVAPVLTESTPIFYKPAVMLDC